MFGGLGWQEVGIILVLVLILFGVFLVKKIFL